MGGDICPPLSFDLPPLGYAEISNLHVNLFKPLLKLNDTINGELCLCKKVPDSTKLHVIKSPKNKFPGEHAPGPP